ncbi:hypothetical protein D1817_08065 [Flavobacteriaceae bacterium]|nr:hypothetical protein D1817_08065 [Flavobacteriaceae bacterium]
MKNLKKLKGVKPLTRKEQQTINGGELNAGGGLTAREIARKNACESGGGYFSCLIYSSGQRFCSCSCPSSCNQL